MKTLFLTLILLTGLYSEQNNSTVFGIEQTSRDSLKTFKQKNGSSFKGIIRGKDFFKYIQLEDGHISLYNKKTDQYEYAVVKDHKLLPSGIPVNTEPLPNEVEKVSEQLLQQLQDKAFKKHL